MEFTSEQERFESGMLARDIYVLTPEQLALRALVDRSFIDSDDENEQKVDSTPEH